MSGTNSFYWVFGSGAVPATISGKGPHTVSYTSSGIKTVKLTVNDTYIKKDINSVAVFDIPNAQYEVTGNTLTSNSPIGNQWYLEGNLIDGATKQSYEIEENGNYFVEICGSQSITRFLIVDGIEEVELDETISEIGTHISIYPNPNSGIFTLKIDSDKDFNIDIINYEIVDITGKVIKFGRINLSEDEHIINAQNLNAGLYFLKIIFPDNYYTSKVVIKK